MTYTAEQQRERYHANLEENRRKHREYARANRDKINEQRRQRRAENGDKIREYERKNRRPKSPGASARERHGRWAVEDLAGMWAAQEGRCYLCGDALVPGREDVDHDHACCRKNRSCRICRRGLAHHRCNVMIGWAQDDPERLRRMADALEAAQAAFRQRRAALIGGEQLPLSD